MSRVIDYRAEQDQDEIPVVCPQCGGPITKKLRTGTVYINGPGDRAWASKYGVEGDGAVETRWWEWGCAGNDTNPGILHAAGPILIGAPDVLPKEQV